DIGRHRKAAMILLVASSPHERVDYRPGALGTVFEWYDFFVYGSLAAFFSTLFFPKESETAALLAALATFGAGFVLRPFGAVVFGRLGDLVGRKKTFLVTILIGSRHRVGRAAADLLDLWLVVSDHPGRLAPAARIRGRRRVRCRSDLCCGAFRSGPQRFHHKLD